MAITQKLRHIEKMGHGQMELITGAFSTTDTTGIVNTRLTRIKAHSFGAFPASNLAAAESLCIYGLTQDAEGAWIVPASGNINVGRVGASVTSGLAFSLTLFGT